MKPKIYWSFFIVILVIAAVIRFFELGNVPHGLTWDEAAIGYNGYAIQKTRRDEWLVRLPVSFRSFGDYKAPLAIYINSAFIYLFGLSPLVVRLPFAIAGVFAIAGFMLLLKELFSHHSRSPAPLIGGLLMTLSPWHIHYSRAGFESGIALALLLWGLYFLCASRRFIRFLPRVGLLTVVAVLLALTPYAYHSAKIVTPILVVIFARLLWKDLWKPKLVEGKALWLHRLSTLISGGVGVVLLIPLIKDIIQGQGLQRIDSSILNDLSGSTLFVTILKNLGSHLNPAFLVQGATTTLRHGSGEWGVLLPTTFILVILGGLSFAYQTWFIKKTHNTKLFLISMLWIVVGLLPAAIGEEIPHSNRALLALPGFLLLAILGGETMLSWLSKTKLNQGIKGSADEHNQIVKATVGMFLLIHAFFAISYLHHYFTVFAKNSADDFKDGYVEAFSYVKPMEDSVDKILFTADYGQPYIYALFVRKTNPIWYQGGSLIKYEFADKITTADLERPNTVIVASQFDDTPLELADYVVYGSDDQPHFKIYSPQVHLDE